MKCKLCGKREAVGEGTGLCDGCWELEHRIKYDPELAIRVLIPMGYFVKKIFEPAKIERDDIFPIRCPECNGSVVKTEDGRFPELQGICHNCGGWYLRLNRTCLASKFCDCAPSSIKDFHKIFYFDDQHHGWFHNVCKRIIQTG